MEERRREFVARGYHIRKLNQAYFAFHGIYRQDPAPVSPIYEALKQLRAKSPSLRDFLDDLAAMRSYAGLTETLEKLLPALSRPGGWKNAGATNVSWD